MWVTGRASKAPCANTNPGVQSSTRPPTTAAVILDVCLMCTPRAARSALRRVDREIDFPRQRLVRDLVGDLDLEPVLALGERREGHRLPALQLMALGEIELRRQRLRVEVLGVRLVEE